MRFPPVLAIDCGASRVSAAAFTATTEGVPVLHRVFVEPLEYDSSDDRQWAHAVGDAIREIGARSGLRGPVVLLLPGHLTLTKYLRVPHVDETKRRKIIDFEARQNIPYPLDEVVWDHQVVSDDGVDFEIALCAVKLDVIDALLAECREIGFEPEVIEPSCMAQVNAFRFCSREARQSTLLINIGARSSNLVFLHEDRYFIRTVTFAGAALTQSISDESGQTIAESERLKQEIAHRGGAGVSPEIMATFDRARQAFVTRLALEVTRSVANYRRQSGVETPTHVFLTGGGSQVPELPAMLAEKLRVPVEYYDPLRRIQFGPGAIEGEFRAQAHVVGESVGVALRAYAQGLTRFNLLPARILRARTFRRRQPFLVGSAALLAGACAIPVLMSSVSAGAFREKVATLDVQLQPLRRYSNEIRRTRGEIETIQQQIAGIKGLVETKSNWISFFTDLQERLVKVEDVWLENLEVLRPQGAQARGSALADSLFGRLTSPQGATPGQAQSLRLRLTGRLLDKNNPLSKVSPESQVRVKTLLNSFVESGFIVALENERFDNSQAGILKFDFILVVDPQRPL
jgi:type IV pilus assembly protein PilM